MENSVIDLIIRIKNGYLAGKDNVSASYSKFKEEVLKKLKQLKFIKDYKIEEVDNVKKVLVIDLLYVENNPALTDVKIFSKPGRRYYVSYKELKPVLSGYGYSILSTPKGIMTNKEARLKKVGGELLFNIW
ncbi:MAG: 30S ribosomal protein S8 [Patescibacteria group bacterium]|nr:MAG: 30S ribosomal protein S8 [Patescibacteria group bacterium]